MALRFGVNDYIVITDDGTYDLNNPITIEFWIKSDGITAGNGDFLRTAVQMRDGAQTTTLIFIPIVWVQAMSSYLVLLSNYDASTFAGWNYGNVPSNHPLGDNRWHHMAFVTNDASANCLLYIDGISEGAPDLNNGAIPDPTSTDTIYIGCAGGLGDFLGAGNTRYLDEVRFWNDARSQKEIGTNMYRRVVGGEGLVACFRLDEPTGTIAYDLLHGPNGTLTNFPAIPWEGGGGITYINGVMAVI